MLIIDKRDSKKFFHTSNDKIISQVVSEKDYYDSVAYSMGEVDKSIVYKRSEEVLDVYNPNTWIKRSRGAGEVEFSINKFPYSNMFLIGFCGRTYVGAYIRNKANELVHSYDMDEILSYALTAQPKRYWYRWQFSDKEFTQEVKAFFYQYHDQDNIHLFHDLNVPIFLVKPKANGDGNSDLIINPLLKEYEFYKIKDAYTAYQEVEQFISGVLTNTEQEVKILDEKTAITSHGFDKKYAFKTRPNN